MNIKEVAKQAKVSVATVSRVINHPELVREDTKDKVLRVMQRLNYSPNWFARSLNLSATNTIAVLVPTIESPFFQRLVAGIEAISNERKYTLILCHTNNDPVNERRHLEALIDRRVDGLIVTSTSLKHEELTKNYLKDIPNVFIGYDERHSFDSSCYISFEEAAFQMTLHLLSMNQAMKPKSFHLFLDERARTRSGNITRGVKRALAQEDITIEIDLIKNDMSAPYVRARNLIAKNELSRIILCSDDEIALAIMRAIHEAKHSVPLDFAIAGLSNSIFSVISSPPLTSMNQPAKKLGMVAGRLLFDKLDGDLSQQQVVLHTVMNIRRSCGNRKFIHELQEV